MRLICGCGLSAGVYGNYMFGWNHPRGSKSGQNEVNQAEIIAAKVFYKSIRAPGKQVSPDHFQAALRMLAPDWAKKILCIILPNRRTVTSESLFYLSYISNWNIRNMFCSTKKCVLFFKTLLPWLPWWQLRKEPYHFHTKRTHHTSHNTQHQQQKFILLLP